MKNVEYQENIAEVGDIIKTSTENTTEYLKQGIKLFETNKFEEALKVFEALVLMDRSSASVYYYYGNTLDKLKRYTDGMVAYKKAIELEPNDAVSYNVQGSALLKLWRYEEALEAFDKAIELKPDYAEAYTGRGKALDNLGRYEEGIVACNKAIEVKPDYAVAYNIQGSALLKLWRYEEALEAFDKAIEVKPDYAEAYSHKGYTLDALKRHEAALKEFDKVIALNPTNEYAYLSQVKIFQKQNMYDKALAVINKLIEQHPTDDEIYQEKGKLCKEFGKYEEALESYEVAIKLKPCPWYELMRKSILVELKRYEEVVQYYEKKIGKCSNYYKNYKEKGVALFFLGRYGEAINDFDKTILLEPDYAEAYYSKGRALHKLKRYKDAIEVYDKAIELEPKDAAYYFDKGCAHNFLAQYEDAIKAFDKAIELGDKYAFAYNQKGYALYGLKKYEEAIMAFDEAIKLEPNFQNALNNKKLALEAIARQTQDKDFTTLLINTPLSPWARKVAQRKIESLKILQNGSSEKSQVEKYLNYLFRLPWGKYDETSIDIIEAEKVLNENHYGLESVKQKIIEALAFMANSQNAKPPILCLVGAPGVGKTSIAQVISKALNRKSVTLSLTGAIDESLVRGCMDFYVGAKPSKVLSLLSEAGSSNPVMILDEIDKISKERGSALEGALLQLIDPSQNDSFTDDYFDFGYDMSKVFFIATANSIDNISYPLLHRMEVIDISGYTDNEKVKITQDYIIPKLMQEANVPSNKFTLSDELIRYIIENYTRESGVRDIERKIRELLQKSLLAEARHAPITLTKETIDEYFKHSKYHKQKLQDDEVTIGMINGLAHTARGGDLIKIEASKYKGDGKIKATGKLGEVLKESIDAAMTCLKSSIDSKTKEISDDILKTHDIHIHLPAGATPKDGPSAGITIYTALYSLLSNKKIRQDIAMTGEITLKGRVLEIGGLKEKLTAAVREGIKEVIIPKDNERDLAEIPEEIKKALVIHPVSNTSEILGIVFDTKVSNTTAKH
ncbi:S16 family serine protease [Rickettsia sp. TH2014]|uniref:S16 family serine protease n=1 Tax=Rickettsia sp. TH2014 TaxID=1967503 RepID=UPI001C443003|nr:S16 family serine protease [Rickettsia sp. TH2014]